MRDSIEVRLQPGDREWLEAVISDCKSPQYYVWRARILLMTADGARTMAIQAATGKGTPTIWRWQKRYARDGADGLFREALREWAFPAALPEQVAAVVERILHQRPPTVTHWTLRSIAKATGLAPSMIHRIWREHGLKPHRVETFRHGLDARGLRWAVGIAKNQKVYDAHVQLVPLAGRARKLVPDQGPRPAEKLLSATSRGAPGQDCTGTR